MTKSEIVQHYMKTLGLTEKEALQLWEDDKADFIGEEGENMTQKAKEIKRYETTGKERKKATKPRKIDANKKYLLETILSTIKSTVSIIKVKTETEINFEYNNESYTLKLIKHNKKK